jgi:hypothetical protein
MTKGRNEGIPGDGRLERREECSSFAVDFCLNQGGLPFYRSLAWDDWQLCLHNASRQKWRNKN